MSGYEFKITIFDKYARCVYRHGGRPEQHCDDVPIQRAEHLETIKVLESWLKRWE